MSSATLTGRLVLAGDIPLGGDHKLGEIAEVIPGVLIGIDRDALRAAPHVPMYEQVAIVPASDYERLRKAAQAVVRRWETPLWKDVPATADVIYALRDALGGAH